MNTYEHEYENLLRPAIMAYLDNGGRAEFKTLKNLRRQINVIAGQVGGLQTDLRHVRYSRAIAAIGRSHGWNTDDDTDTLSHFAKDILITGLNKQIAKTKGYQKKLETEYSTLSTYAFGKLYKHLLVDLQLTHRDTTSRRMRNAIKRVLGREL